MSYIGRCTFTPAWQSRCCNVCAGDFCDRHSGIKCSSCGEQATTECAHTGQFVCGAPLCPKCHGCEDHEKPSGNWGFLNHYHKRRDAPTRAEQRAEDAALSVESAALGVGSDLA